MNLRYTITLITILLSYSIQAPVYAGADTQVVDSLKTAIQNAARLPDSQAGDTSICNAYISWGEAVYQSNRDTAILLWHQTREIAERNLASDIVKDTILEKKYLFSLANALNNIAIVYDQQGKIPEALEYHQKSLKIVEQLGDKAGTATSLNNIALIHMNKGDIQKALEYMYKSLAIKEEIDDKRGMAISFNSIGYIYNNQGDIPKALDYFHKCMKLHEETGDKEGIARSLNNMASVYKQQGEITKALEYHQKSLKIQEEIGNKFGLAFSLNNIGGVYREQGDTSKALEYYRKSLKIREEIGYKRGIAESFNNIGAVYNQQGDIPKALEFLYKGLKIKEEIGDQEGIAVSLNNIGAVELAQGELAQAQESGNRGLKIARKLGAPDLMSAISRLLSKVAKQQGNFEVALEMYELHIQMRDSIKNEETHKATIRQQTKYEFEKAQLVKEQEDKEQARVGAERNQRRDNLQYSVIFIAILILFGAVLSLGFVNVSERLAEGIIFFSFLILFEFLLVLADPYIDIWSGGAPGIKLLFNAGIAALIFPLHSLFERKLKGRLSKG